jgi:hypothetical protein
VNGEARREKAKELVDAGLSVRATAKALGVSKSTVQRDVSQSDSAPKSDKAQTERRAELELAAKLPTNGVIVAAPQPPSEPSTNLAEPAPEQPPEIVELSLGEKVAALASKACHWPIGDPQHPEFRFCGSSVTAPPYCEAHRAVAYVALPSHPAPRRRRRRLYTSVRGIAWAG